MYKLQENADFNTMRNSGFYRLSSTSSSPNKPKNFSTSYGNAIVSRGGDTCVQIVFCYSDATRFATRMATGLDGSNENWGEWNMFKKSDA